MKAVYLFGSLEVKSKLGEAQSFEEAKLRASKMGTKTFVIPANVTFDMSHQEGGYDAVFLRKAAGKGKARAYTIPWAKLRDDTPFCEVDGKDASKPWHSEIRKEVVKHIAAFPWVDEAWESQGTAGLLIITEKPRGAPWGWGFKTHLGMEWCQGGKVVKRGTQAWSRWYLGYLEDDQITADCFRVVKGKFLEKRLDGAIGLPMVCKEMMIETMKVSDEVKEKLRRVHVWNGRIFLPGGILPEAPEGGLIKGEFYFSEFLTQITFHECNIKKEMRIEKGQPVRMAMTPQEGKLRERDTDQFYTCAPWLFTKEDRKARITRAFQKFKEDFLTGKMEVNLIELEEKVASGRLEETGQYVQTSRLLGMALGAGVPKEWIPRCIWEEHLLGQGRKMIDLEKAKLRVPLPYATHCQVVSESLMRMIKPGFLSDQGLGERIPLGHMVFDEEYKLYVVGDKDYENHVIVTHGGSDLDDFYAEVIRKVNGKVCVFLFRSPCGWGEWSVYQLDGYLPKGWKREDVPEIPKSEIAKSVPRSLSKVKVSDGLLPGTKADWSKRYDYEAFCKTLDASGEGAGGIVNLISFYDLHLRYAAGKKKITYDTSLPFSMEKIIDTVTQCDNPKNIPILDAFVNKLKIRLRGYIRKGGECEEAFVYGKKIDKVLFDKEDQVQLNLVKGDFTEVFEHAEKERAAYEEWVKKTVKDTFLLPNKVVEGTDAFLQRKARAFEQGWRGCFGAGEKRRTRNGNEATASGFTTISQRRAEYVRGFDKSKDGTLFITKIIPYLVQWVYASPQRAAVKWEDDWIMRDPIVFQEWVKWCVQHLEDLREEHNNKMVQDSEDACLARDEGEYVKILPVLEWSLLDRKVKKGDFRLTKGARVWLVIKDKLEPVVLDRDVECFDPEWYDDAEERVLFKDERGTLMVVMEKDMPPQ